jgi:hypothetical protein
MRRKFITGGVIKFPPLEFPGTVGAILAFKFQYLFQCAQQKIRGADIAFAVGSGDVLDEFVEVAFKLAQALLQQLLEALDGGAGALPSSPRLCRVPRPAISFGLLMPRLSAMA